MRSQRIAIVGIGLRYPDAGNPSDFWSNVLAGRRAFRTIPEERMSLSDYWDPDPAAPDAFYSRKAAVLRDYEFDRVGHMISTRTMTSTDMTHWLALDVAAEALAAAGFADGTGLPRSRTGVVLGNTLTGEFSRANVMRLRWPYVRRTVSSQLGQRGWDVAEIDTFVHELEALYKAPFPAATEDMLAGGLANTIAGRICNYFDLGGGGFTVDGACSSSLLSIISAANALVAGDLDVALAGGVDLSIDPFELIGFAKTGALAQREMLVYDRDSNGFWPGEGCGVVVLMREEDARAQGRPVIACITGWGMSSDGKGGITRPEVDGHRRALAAAYARAGYESSTVSYFEGHGTGTAVGDATEIAALASTRDAATDPWPAALSSVKANIGHTKAAAGVAGLIKAALSLHHGVIPPATGHLNPHELLATHADAVRVPSEALPYHPGVPTRAGVSAMGFGGINTHIALEGSDAAAPEGSTIAADVVRTVRARQDAELLVLGADDIADLCGLVRRTADTLERAALCELGDLAAHLQRTVGCPRYRLALVARTPDEAVGRICRAADALGEPVEPARLARIGDGTWFGHGTKPGRVAFAFPGQGAGTGADGAFLHRFAEGAAGAAEESANGTAALQPRIVRRSLQAVTTLTRLGLQAECAVGHSLGEVTALAWAGALTPEEAVDVARRRGRAMADRIPGTGAMAVVAADADTTERYLARTEASIAGYNAPALTVVAGSRTSVDAVTAAAVADGVEVTRLDVEHAFHTSHCADAAAEFGRDLEQVRFSGIERPVLSAALGGPLPADADLGAFLARQVTDPVRFSQATSLLEGYDLIVEVGPGRALAGLLAANVPGALVASVDTDSGSMVPGLDALAAAFALGHHLELDLLGKDRVQRPMEVGQAMTFLANPCERAPDLDFVPSALAGDEASGGTMTESDGASTLEVLIATVAGKVDLPASMLGPATSPLDDLHMSSITVGQITNEALRALGRGPMTGVPSFATSSLGDIAEMIDQMADGPVDDGHVAGAGAWIRVFTEESTTTPLLGAPAYGAPRPWTTVGDTDGMTAAVADRLARLAGVEPGVLVSTTGRGPDAGTEAIEAAVRAVTAVDAATPLVVLQRGDHGAAAAARSLLLEGVTSRTVVVHLPPEPEDPDMVPAAAVADSVAAEVVRTQEFIEVRYTREGARTHSTWSVTPTAAGSESYLTPDDVLLVSGGGKGITAESAIRLASHSGCALLLLGRSAPDHPDVAATLEQARREGVRHVYARADVSAPDEVSAAVASAEETFGPITAILHGAGTNTPVRAADLTRADLDRTIAPKVHGLRTLLDSVDPAKLRLVLAFGSIIGRAGLAGEVHYATANSWLTEEVLAVGRAYPHIRARCVEWSVWSGAGMGERLGVLESLQRQGIEPIPSEWGVSLVTSLVDDKDLPPVAMVSGRTGSFATMRYANMDLPLLRFLENPRIHYPGVELVTDSDLTPGTDPYLADHVLDGEMILPAVIGMEAMAQVAVSLQPSLGEGLAFQRLRFDRPVIVPAGEPATVRLAALVEDGGIRVVLRSGSTGFAVDHFSAIVTAAPALPAAQVVSPAISLPPIGVDAGRELYGSLMFQAGRFRKVRDYRVATARQAVANLDTASQGAWFSFVHPQELVLADPGARDAMMHAIQCCVPDAVLLPEGVDVLVPAMATGAATSVVMEALERSNDGDAYAYDLRCYDEEVAVECWSGLRLRAVKRRGPETFRASPAMVGPYLQRRSEGVFGLRMEVVVEPHVQDGTAQRADFRAATDRALSRLRPGLVVYRRGDGRLVIEGGSTACSAHHDRFTLAIVGDGAVACDAEGVTPRSEVTWHNLLGDAWPLAREIAQVTDEPFDAAATRVWGAMECVRKVGHAAVDLALGPVDGDDVVIVAGSYRVLTSVLPTGDDHTMFALLGGS